MACHLQNNNTITKNKYHELPICKYAILLSYDFVRFKNKFQLVSVYFTYQSLVKGPSFETGFLYINVGSLSSLQLFTMPTQHSIVILNCNKLVADLLVACWNINTKIVVYP